MTQNFSAIRQAFRDRILTVSGWAESPIPFELFSVDAAPDQPAAPMSDHLFVVGVPTYRDSGATRSRGGGEALMEAEVVVRLVGRIVPNQRQTSVDSAIDAMQGVFLALMAQGTPWPGDVGILLDGDITPAASASGEWLVTDLRFRARWTMALS